MTWGDCGLSVAAAAALEALLMGRPGIALLPASSEGRKRRAKRRALLYQKRLSNAGAKGVQAMRRRLRPPRHAVMEEQALVGLGHDEATIGGLISDGWLARWEVADRPERLTLTCWGAERAAQVLVESAGEVPHWEREPPPPMKGEPAPKPAPIVMPAGYRTRRLPSWELRMFPSREMGPEAEAEAKEEFVMQQETTAYGEEIRDEGTGMPNAVPVICRPTYAPDDGLKGGLGVPWDGRIPRAKPRRKVSKKKRKRKAG